MARTTCAIAALVLGAMACRDKAAAPAAAPPAPAPVAAPVAPLAQGWLPPAAPLDRLARDSGTTWTYRIDPDGTFFLAPVGADVARVLVGADPTAMLWAFFASYGPDLAIDAAMVGLRPLGASPGDAGFGIGPEVAFQQVIAGVPVWGAALVVELAPTGGIAAIGGRYVLDPLGTDQPWAVAEADALVAARAAVEAALPGEDPAWLAAQTALERVWLPSGADPLRPAYAGRWRSPAGGEVAVVVDATDGSVPIVDTGRRELVTGTGLGMLGDPRSFPVTDAGAAAGLRRYQMTAPAEAGAAEAPPASCGALAKGAIEVRYAGMTDPVAAESPSGWHGEGTDAAGLVVDAYWNLRAVESYFRRRFCRASYDGKGSPLSAVVLAPDAGWNAAWHPGPRQIWLSHSKPDERKRSPAAAIDIIGHEYAHAIAWSLRPWFATDTEESGAIEEGLGDVMGALVEHHVAPDPERNPVGGDRVAFEAMDPPGDGVIRDAREPRTYRDAEPDPHQRSTLISHAWYRMTYGATPAESLTWAESESLWYAALGRIHRTPTVPVLAARMMADVKAKSARERRVVGCTWAAVGVLRATDLTPYGIDCGIADATLLGHWNWTLGEWGTLSLVKLGVDKGRVVVRGVYPEYRDGAVTLTCDASIRWCVGQWTEESRRCDTKPDHGTAKFRLTSRDAIDGVWRHARELHWRQNWDLERAKEPIPDHIQSLFADSNRFRCR
jgi:Zn-dependent metalloprotease